MLSYHCELVRGPQYCYRNGQLMVLGMNLGARRSCARDQPVIDDEAHNTIKNMYDATPCAVDYY